MKTLSAEDKKLWRLVQKPIDFRTLCDKMGLPPGKVESLLTRARKRGTVQVSGEWVGRAPGGAGDPLTPTVVVPPKGKVQKVGVISDLHFGSKYCLRAQLRDCVHIMYRLRIREILIPGDILQGEDHRWRFELTHHGIAAQCKDAIKGLPKLRGLTYYAIGGNHDDKFDAAVGMSSVDYIESQFRLAGRKDFRAIGHGAARIKLRGATIDLWHPHGGAGYAISYPLHKRIEGYGPGDKPDILLAGHWHRFGHVEGRGVHAFACPTFQGGKSFFARRMRAPPELGGLILHWQLTEHGTLRRFGVERVVYYEKEVQR